MFLNTGSMAALSKSGPSWSWKWRCDSLASWPKARDAKFVRLRAKGAFTVSSEQRAGAVQYIDVASDKGNRFTLVNPWSTRPVTVVDGAGRVVTQTNAGGNISFPTTAGQTYRITVQP